MVKEVKEMSIESIKSEIIDKLINNMDILGCLGIEKYLKMGYKISNIYNSLIFNYDSSSKETDYITVEAEEHEFSVSDPNDHKRYKVIINMGLEREKNLDNLAAFVKGIIMKLYPDRKNYSSVPVYRKTSCGNMETHRLNRKITFEIETDAYVK